jgi:hypothetical protein
MRIYRRKEFLALPAGTIYAKGKPWYFDGFSVKGDTWTNDWLTLSPMWIEAHDDGEQWQRLEAMLEAGASYPLQESFGRDGCFDDEDIFLVPEKADLEKLRAMVDAALTVAK